VVSSRFYIYDISGKNGRIGILLSDYTFWAENYVRLDEWCKKHCLEYSITGCLLELNNQKDLTLFTLQWHE